VAAELEGGCSSSQSVYGPQSVYRRVPLACRTCARVVHCNMCSAESKRVTFWGNSFLSHHVRNDGIPRHFASRAVFPFTSVMPKDGMLPTWTPIFGNYCLLCRETRPPKGQRIPKTRRRTKQVGGPMARQPELTSRNTETQRIPINNIYPELKKIIRAF
jgi:hypothetical protein